MLFRTICPRCGGDLVITRYRRRGVICTCFHCVRDFSFWRLFLCNLLIAVCGALGAVVVYFFARFLLTH